MVKNNKRTTLVKKQFDFVWIHLQHTRIALAFPAEIFSLFLSLKTTENSSGQMLQLYAYVANESTLNKNKKKIEYTNHLKKV